jgi:2,5-dioxopentanoate dehydrogenase
MDEQMRSTSPIAPRLLNGRWQSHSSAANGIFLHGFDPRKDTARSLAFPQSDSAELEIALQSAHNAAGELAILPPERFAAYLELYASKIEQASERLGATAAAETGLAADSRLVATELPRTILQLRLAAKSASARDWCLPTIDRRNNIRSYHAGLHKPVVIFGPNNFPFAYNAIAGGDFAAAIAAGNPVIAKAHPGHPETSWLLARLAFEAVAEEKLPLGCIQMVYDMPPEVGLQLVADHRVGAFAFTGSRVAGLRLKAAADSAGVPCYLEMSSTNPIIILPGAMRERAAEISGQIGGSVLASGGQFCTKPGLLFVIDDENTVALREQLIAKVNAEGAHYLLQANTAKHYRAGAKSWLDAGATSLARGADASASCTVAAQLFGIAAANVIRNPRAFLLEVFGPCALLIAAKDQAEMLEVVALLDGQLSASVYHAGDGNDEALYNPIAAILRQRCGRLLNNKVTTGVAVSGAMNHGGPYPATGHPGFTAVGFPASIRRFSALQCFDNVGEAHLPAELRDANPLNVIQLLV